jgi:hypothetical protein
MIMLQGVSKSRNILVLKFRIRSVPRLPMYGSCMKIFLYLLYTKDKYASTEII